MTYKDPDKQREANKQASQRRRDRKGMTQSMTKGMTVTGSDTRVIPKQSVTKIDERSNEPSNVIPKCGAAPIDRTPYAELRGDKIVTLKRGKDIKTFEDLPPDVQEVIHKLSTIDGKIDQRVKANRTAIAINYQHLFPDRYNSTGVAV